MAIDYMICVGCPVKNFTGSDNFVPTVKRRTCAELILAKVRDRGDNRPLSEITFEKLRYTPDGGAESHTVSIQEEMDATEELHQLADICSNCPASYSESRYGCFQSIPYPINIATEKWLMSLLPDNIRSVTGCILQNLIIRTQVTGAPIDAVRHDPVLYESRSPIVRSWSVGGAAGLFGKRYTLSSSQILELLFFQGPITPDYASSITLGFGFIPGTTDPELLRTPGGSQTAIDFTRLHAALGDPVIGPTAEFLMCMLRACYVLNVDLWVDP